MGHFERALAQSFLTTPPRAYAASGAGPFGQEVTFAVSAVAQYVDLRALTFGVVYNPTAADTAQGSGAPPKGAVGAVGSFITIFADGADLGVVLGPTVASVSTANVPSLAVTGVLNSDGSYSSTNGTCHRIPAGQERRYRLVVTQDNYLGIVASGAGVCRMFVSSEPALQ